MPESVCIGDTVYLTASGGAEYQWSTAPNIYTSANGVPAVQLVTPQSFTVTVTSAYSCVDSATFTVSNIEPCCQFSYPNAFTPNNDGKNDVFRPVIYGHTQSYQFSVYDRWGERIFNTFSQYEPWDGTFGGKPCMIGTYFYTVNAQCLSGKQEQHKGDVTLIR